MSEIMAATMDARSAACCDILDQLGMVWCKMHIGECWLVKILGSPTLPRRSPKTPATNYLPVIGAAFYINYQKCVLTIVFRGHEST